MRRLLSLVGVLLCAGIATAHVRESLPLRESASLAEADGLAEHSGVLEAPAIDPTFKFKPDAQVPAIANLKTELCVNGTCMAPQFVYDAANISGASWTPTSGYGETLTRSGGAWTTGLDTPLHDTSKAATFADLSVYQGATNGAAEIGTKDFVIEYIIYLDTSSIKYFAQKATGGTGWIFYINGGSSDSGTLNGHWFDCSSSGFGWRHVVISVNNSNNAIRCVNNAVASSASKSGTFPAPGWDATVATPWQIGEVVSGSPNITLLRFALYTCNGCLSDADATLVDAVAKERFYRLSGVWPASARVPGPPAIVPRGSGATLTKYTNGVARLFYVGYGWPRVHRLADGGAYFWIEPGVTNTFLQSRNLSASWTQLDAGDTVGGSVVTPSGLTSTTAGLIADGTNGDHGVSQAATVTAAVWTSSVQFKAGSRTCVYGSDDTVANATGYFNASNCTTMTKGAGARELFATDLGNGWCEVGLSFTGTAASHTFKWQVCDGDGDKTVTGDGVTVTGYFTEMQLEAGAYPSSRIPTTTATVLRERDVMRFTGASNIGASRGSLVCTVYTPAHSGLNPGGFMIPLTISQDGLSTHRILLSSRSNSDSSAFVVIDGGVTQANIDPNTFDMATGALRTVAGSYAVNEFMLFGDGAQHGTTDTSGTIPAGLNRINIGSDQGETLQFNGGIRQCCLFDVTGVRSCL